MKSGRPRTIKLSPRALALLDKIRTSKPPGSDPTRKLFRFNDRALARLMVEMGYSPDLATPHGFRATFTGWAKKYHLSQVFAREMALDHKAVGSLGTAYERDDYLEERYNLGLEWEKVLTGRFAREQARIKAAKLVNEVEDDQRMAAD